MAELTEGEREAAFYAWALHAKGCGFAPQPRLLPDCERMREKGWLERRMIDHDAIYFWTDQAELALDVNALTQSVEGREN